ncbi:MAG: tetratricopeptide repeat protein [Alphaproteobacteria bacterium]|nr:tetratricopeptide repeat protein [Alphaproteobacteria bacterium]
MNRAERRRQAKQKEKQNPAAGDEQDSPDAQINRALGLLKAAIEAHQSGRLNEAEDLYWQILAIDPGQANANHLLGVIAEGSGRGAEAAALIARAIKSDPVNPSYHFDLANVYRAQGRLEDAARHHFETIRLKPDMAEAHTNLGLVLEQMGRAEEACACHREAIRLKPGFAQAHDNLGCALQDLCLLANAVASYNDAIRLEPDFANAHYNLGTAHHEMGRAADATDCFEAAITFDPGHVRALANRLLTQQYVPSVSPDGFIDTARQWATAFVKPSPASLAAPTNTPDPDRPLRVGYVSADFRTHPVGFYIINVLAAHDRGQVETFCYSASDRADDLTERLRDDADHWRNIAGASDNDAQELIRGDGIDILVDLAGHTTGNRLGIFAGRVAPIQLGWMGYCATTGLETMDYVLADATVAPEGDEALFTERVWRLPGQYLCFAPPETDISINARPPGTDAPIIFGSFNNLAKVTDETVAVWAQILNARPDARLVFKAKQFDTLPGAREALIERFSTHGVAVEQLAPEGPSPRDAFLADYNRIDIALDPFPFSGGATTLEALWMGVPVLTMKNDRWAGRVSETLLKAAGLDQWVAGDEKSYLDRALELAAQGPRPEADRIQLRQRLEASPVCDGAGFTRSLEAAYREMWRVWCEAA